jgi:hypothetical protein
MIGVADLGPATCSEGNAGIVTQSSGGPDTAGLASAGEGVAEGSIPSKPAETAPC